MEIPPAPPCELRRVRRCLDRISAGRPYFPAHGSADQIKPCPEHASPSNEAQKKSQTNVAVMLPSTQFRLKSLARHLPPMLSEYVE